MNILSVLTGCESGYKRTEAYPFRRVNFALPYLAVCAALALGEAAGFAAAPASAYWPFALFVLVIFSLIAYGNEIPYWHLPAVFLLGFTLALVSESCRSRVFDTCDYSSEPFTADFEVKGRVCCSGSFVSFNSDVDGVDMRIIIRREPAEDADDREVPSIGETWRCSGWLERKARDERVRRTLWVSGPRSSAARIAEAQQSTFTARLQRLRRSLSANIGYGLSHNPMAADLDRAIILGERSSLSHATRRMFADAGTIHVFAISGLHVGIIAQMVVYLLMALFLFPLRWVVIPLIPILGSYVVMIDAPPSAVRAAVMSIAYYSAPLFYRRSDSLVAWAITFIVFHLLDPAMLFNVGSVMSFSVMLGILLFVRWAQAFKSDGLVSWGVSVAAWASGVAIAAHVFERLTIGGLVANVLMIPLALLSVVLGFLGAISGYISPWVASHFNNAAALLIDAMTGLSWAISRIPYANLAVEPWPLWMCAAWYAVIVMALWLIRSVYIHRKECL